MMQFLFFPFLVLPIIAHSQWKEDFSGTLSPAWKGDTASYRIINGMLGSASVKPNDLFCISRSSSSVAGTVWQGYVELRFATSGSNYVELHLMTDSLDAATGQNGYFVRVGGSKDRISLFRRYKGKDTEIIPGTNGRSQTSSSVNKLFIRATRDKNFHWNLESDLTGTGNAFVPEGNTTDSSVITSSYFAVLIKQSTASFFKKHFFDDLEIVPVRQDTTAPRLVKSVIRDKNTIVLEFSEPVDSNPVCYMENYAFDTPGITVQAVYRDSLNPKSWVLVTSTPFQSPMVTSLAIKELRDISGNLSGPQYANLVYFIPREHDLLISEIMADPDPPVGLPNTEYVEIYNRSDFSITTNGWKLTSGTTVKLPDSVVPPHGYVLLCSSSSAPLFDTVSKWGLNGFPSLTNTGDEVALFNLEGVCIHRVNYTDDWYKDNKKKNGGWSLEMVNPNRVCAGEENWKASESSTGGTPGYLNAVADTLPDKTPPKLLSAYIVDSSLVKMVFSEQPDSTALIRVRSNNPSRYFPDISIKQHQLIVGIVPPMQQEELLEMIVGQVQDCIGNLMPDTTLPLRLPEVTQPGDVIINEVLFNPQPYGYDFVELYNQSEKSFSLSRLKLGTWKDGVLADTHVTGTSEQTLAPGSYLVCSLQPSDISTRYPGTVTNNLSKMSKMPAMPDEEGIVVVTDEKGNMLDRLDYNQNMHFPLLDNKEGVSLERISPLISTEDKANWHSAASDVGYATPGYRNSQFRDYSSKISGKLLIEPVIFSPDGDGYNDFTLITIYTETPGELLNLSVFNEYGVLVKSLAANQLLGTEYVLQWDGTDNRHRLLPAGRYVLLASVFDLKGYTHTEKAAVVLAEKLD